MGNQKHFGALCHPTSTVLLYFYHQIFENFQNLEFCVRHFFAKIFPNFSKKFLNFFSIFKIENNYDFCNQISPKLFGAENWEFYVPKPRLFLELGSSLGKGPLIFVPNVCSSIIGAVWVAYFSVYSNKDFIMLGDYTPTI